MTFLLGMWNALFGAAAKDALGYFHPSDIIEPLKEILQRENVVVATFQRHMNEFCLDSRGPVMERHGAARAYRYRFHDPLLPPYIFMTSLNEGKLNAQQIQRLTSRQSA